MAEIYENGAWRTRRTGLESLEEERDRLRRELEHLQKQNGVLQEQLEWERNRAQKHEASEATWKRIADDLRRSSGTRDARARESDFWKHTATIYERENARLKAELEQLRAGQNPQTGQSAQSTEPPRSEHDRSTHDRSQRGPWAWTGSWPGDPRSNIHDFFEGYFNQQYEAAQSQGAKGGAAPSKTRLRLPPDCEVAVAFLCLHGGADGDSLRFGQGIKEAYRVAARKLHPDAGGSHEEFVELSRHTEKLKGHFGLK